MVSRSPQWRPANAAGTSKVNQVKGAAARDFHGTRPLCNSNPNAGAASTAWSLMLAAIPNRLNARTGREYVATSAPTTKAAYRASHWLQTEELRTTVGTHQRTANGRSKGVARYEQRRTNSATATHRPMSAAIPMHFMASNAWSGPNTSDASHSRYK